MTGTLWNELFKPIYGYRKRRAIAFASYGCPSLFIHIKGLPILVLPVARVGLLPIAHKDNLPAAGLLFTCAEFNELVLMRYLNSEYLFHSSFLDMIFKITEGHVGAIHAFLEFPNLV